jgi:uncharacterized protein involved in outer membrane biogenesis
MKFLKKLLISLLILIFLVAGSVFILLTFYKKELTQHIIDSLKTNYGLNLEVEEIKVSFISNWPLASVELRNVFISGDQQYGGSIVKAGSLALSFNIKKMLNQEFIVNNIAIKDAEINFVKSAEGKKNFEVKKQDQDTLAKSSPLKFEINKITLKNSNFSYVNEGRGQKISISFISTTIRLKDYLDGVKGAIKGKVFVNGLLFHPETG